MKKKHIFSLIELSEVIYIFHPSFNIEINRMTYEQ